MTQVEQQQWEIKQVHLHKDFVFEVDRIMFPQISMD